MVHRRLRRLQLRGWGCDMRAFAASAGEGGGVSGNFVTGTYTGVCAVGRVFHTPRRRYAINHVCLPRHSLWRRRVPMVLLVLLVLPRLYFCRSSAFAPAAFHLSSFIFHHSSPHAGGRRRGKMEVFVRNLQFLSKNPLANVKFWSIIYINIVEGKTFKPQKP